MHVCDVYESVCGGMRGRVKMVVRERGGDEASGELRTVCGGVKVAV